MCANCENTNPMTPADWSAFEQWGESDSAPAVVFNKLDREAVLPGMATAKVPAYTCNKCRGTGIVTFGYRNPQTGKCHACNGRGGFTSSPEARNKAKAARMKKANNKQEEVNVLVARFKAEHNAVFGSLLDGASRGSNFCKSLLDQLFAKGELSANQIAAVERGMQKQPTASVALDKPSLGGGHKSLYSALCTARRNNLRYPKIRVAELVFSLASAASTNVGCIYVKSGDTYLGKITADGRWCRSRDCNDMNDQLVQEVCKDPLAQAIAHGIKTGICSCCGRELTDPKSIAAGIGPICASNFGW